MRKFVFYHIYPVNDYVQIHNNIFSKIVSNPFFDDCTFFFSVALDKDMLFNKDRLILPQNIFITEYKNEGSEYPAFIEVKKRSKEHNFNKEDIIGYFHCKGASNKGYRYNPNPQLTLLSAICIQEWVEELSFFLITYIEKYIKYLYKYGTLCSYPVRHVFGNEKICGTTGNFWWATGDVVFCSQKIKEEKVQQHTRHYFEALWLQEMLQLSDRKYKSGFYIHDGDSSFYASCSSAKTHLVNAYWSEELVNLANMDIPFTSFEESSIGIIIENTNSLDYFFNLAVDFIKNQRFKNLWLCPKQKNIDINKFNTLCEKHQTKNITHKKEKSIIYIELDFEKFKSIKEEHYMDRLACAYRNSSDAYDIHYHRYKNVPYDNILIKPNNLTIKNHEDIDKKGKKIMNHIKMSLMTDSEIEDLARVQMVDKNYNGHFYTKWYNLYFSPLKDEDVNILEIGIMGGGSHRMWRDYFSKGKIYAVDIDPITFEHDLSDIECFLGDATDENFLEELCQKIPSGLDIIIDDASHRTSDQVKTFNFMFEKLNSGGIYVVEDLHTTYHPGWQTPPHTNAVDYFINLVNDLNLHGKLPHNDYYKATKKDLDNFNYMEKNIESIHFYTGICFIFKR